MLPTPVAANTIPRDEGGGRGNRPVNLSGGVRLAISWRYKLVELCAKSQSRASCDQRGRSRRLRHREMASQPQPRGRTSEIDNTSGCPSWKTSLPSLTRLFPPPPHPAIATWESSLELRPSVGVDVFVLLFSA